MSGRSITRRRAQRGQATRRLLLVVLVLAITVGVVYAGVRARSGDEPAASSPSPSASSTPSSTVDLSQLPIEREEFCDRLDDADVEAALGAPVSDTGHYRSG